MQKCKNAKISETANLKKTNNSSSTNGSTDQWLGEEGLKAKKIVWIPSQMGDPTARMQKDDCMGLLWHIGR